MWKIGPHPQKVWCTGTPPYSVLYSMMLHRYCIFYRLKICGSPALSNSIGVILLTAFAHFMSQCPVLVILAIFQAFPKLLRLLWWPVISDRWYYHCNCLGVLWTASIQDSELDECCVCSDWYTDGPFPPFFPSPWAPLFPETQQYWI